MERLSFIFNETKVSLLRAQVLIANNFIMVRALQSNSNANTIINSTRNNNKFMIKKNGDIVVSRFTPEFASTLNAVPLDDDYKTRRNGCSIFFCVEAADHIAKSPFLSFIAPNRPRIVRYQLGNSQFPIPKTHTLKKLKYFLTYPYNPNLAGSFSMHVSSTTDIQPVRLHRYHSPAL